MVPDKVILGLLAAHPRHGYDLLNQFRSRDRLGRIWTMSTSQVYAVLKQLGQAGLITGRQVTSSDAPPRIEYTVTDAGRRCLEAWLNEPQPSTSIRRIRVEFLSRLYVAHLLGIPAEGIIERQRAACLKQIDYLRKERSRSASEFEHLTLDFVIGQLEAALQWLDQCMLHQPDIQGE
ncbi:MAG: PadR family transcriptional regulator [Anaerolineae bacterium]